MLLVEWQEGHQTCKKPVPLIPKDSLFEQVGGEKITWGEPANPGLPGELLLNGDGEVVVC